MTQTDGTLLLPGVSGIRGEGPGTEASPDDREAKQEKTPSGHAWIRWPLKRAIFGSEIGIE